MPMTYTIDPELRLVRIVGTGRLTDDEMVDCVTALRSDPVLRPDMNTLSDMRNIEVAFTAEGVSRMRSVMEGTATRQDARAAIVAASDVAFGMARMFELRSTDRVSPRIQVFRELSEARAWLGIE